MTLLALQLLSLTVAIGVLDAIPRHYSYQFLLNANNMEGFVDAATAEDNDYVHILKVERSESGELEGETEHIILEISTTQYKKAYFQRNNLDINNENIKFPPEFSATNTSKKGSLPSDIKIDVIHTTAFTVNSDLSLRLSDDLDELRKKSVIQFYIVLANTSSSEIVSNPLPFMIHVKPRPKELREHGAAIYAGIIVLIIVAIALLVPFTVRAKRRRRAGKPICGFGSAKSPEDIQKAKLAGKDNGAMIFDDGKGMSRTSSVVTDTGHESMQQHMVRSVSDFHFQPTWLDPHYQDSHHHHHNHYHTNKTSNGVHSNNNSKSTEERL
ncbi:hypothetical protein SNE40_014759 [Patella caerulea]|uniref:Uncharacterized protein n=1 Tax=Patella caerulea TaxID=87958 RepID=A0AAN8JFB4_PATCE